MQETDTHGEPSSSRSIRRPDAGGHNAKNSQGSSHSNGKSYRKRKSRGAITLILAIRLANVPNRQRHHRQRAWRQAACKPRRCGQQVCQRAQALQAVCQSCI
jgi:hypothetical protein